jgi:hypothetical protein
VKLGGKGALGKLLYARLDCNISLKGLTRHIGVVAEEDDDDDDGVSGRAEETLNNECSIM